MGADTYKKRMKGNWNQGKGCKGDSEERMFAKEEIRQCIREMDEDYKEIYKKSKRKRNEKMRLEHRIEWYTKAMDRIGGGLIKNYFRNNLEKARKQLAELIEKEKQ